jgi:membrane fusion protein, multidrug efflux system
VGRRSSGSLKRLDGVGQSRKLLLVFNVSIRYGWTIYLIDLLQLDVSTLVSNPKVTAEGTVREIAPAVDTNSGTVRVKIGIPQTPPAMTLGAVVTGSGNLKSSRAVILPWGALFEIDGKPAVWIVASRNRTVSLRPIVIDAYLKDRIIVASGLDTGDVVVTAGVQYLRPQQKVALANEPPQ